MGFFDKFKREIRSEELTGDALLRQIISDKELSIEQALAIPGMSGSINFVANKIAQLPVRMYKQTDIGIIEIFDDKRLHLLNIDTGDTMTPYQMKQALVRDYFISDNGGNIYIARDNFGEITALKYVSANNITFTQNHRPIWRDYSIIVPNENEVGFYPHDFIRIVRHSKDGITGSSILKENADMLKAGNALIKYTTYLMKTGGTKKGFLKSSKKLTEDALDKLKAAWARLYSSDSSNNMMVLNDGIDYAPAQSTSVELQLSENQKLVENGICMLFNLSPDVTAGKGTYQQQFSAIEVAVMPIVEEIINSLNRDLLLESEKGKCFFRFDTSLMCKADVITRYNAYATGLRESFLQLNEVRKKENMEPLEGMDGLVRLQLNDVLYNTKTHTVFNINSNTVADVSGENAGELSTDNNGNDKI